MLLLAIDGLIFIAVDFYSVIKYNMQMPKLSYNYWMVKNKVNGRPRFEVVIEINHAYAF